ncbi:MAG: cytochrome c [Halobacteriovoraceae bacterium]|jgi:nitric oxide reductase subunit C|nr:cytochrome c [Halobacteriovoraceae bacterium]
MLSKSAARNFFLIGTFLCFGSFILLTVDTISQVPKQTNEHKLTESVARGKHLFDANNCMGCHTILGEGAYYAPELTKVIQRRGARFVRKFINDPQKYGRSPRKMVDYDFNDQELDDLVAFFTWIGEVDLNGFPPEPNL